MEQADVKKPLLAGKELLQELAPLADLSSVSLDALAEALVVERIDKGADPTKIRKRPSEAIYLIKGDLGVRYLDGKKIILRGGTTAAKKPIHPERLGIQAAIALTWVDIIRVDLDVLAVTQTWDQMIALTNRMHGQLKRVLARVAVD